MTKTEALRKASKNVYIQFHGGNLYSASTFCESRCMWNPGRCMDYWQARQAARDAKIERALQYLGFQEFQAESIVHQIRDMGDRGSAREILNDILEQNQPEELS